MDVQNINVNTTSCTEKPEQACLSSDARLSRGFACNAQLLLEPEFKNFQIQMQTLPSQAWEISSTGRQVEQRRNKLTTVRQLPSIEVVSCRILRRSCLAWHLQGDEQHVQVCNISEGLIDAPGGNSPVQQGIAKLVLAICYAGRISYFLLPRGSLSLFSQVLVAFSVVDCFVVAHKAVTTSPDQSIVMML